VADKTALSPPKMQEGAFQLGLLQFCNQSVKKCYGCGQLLKMQRGDGQWQVPPAPNDLVIITAMRRPYWQNGVQKRGSPSNVYFLCRVECVRAMQAAFLPFLVVIPTVLRPHLLPVHSQRLAQELGLSISCGRVSARVCVLKRLRRGGKEVIKRQLVLLQPMPSK